MSKKIVTNRNEYPVIFCVAINNGVFMEIEDERPIYAVAEEFDAIESMEYVNDDDDTGRAFDCPLKLQMIQDIDEITKQIRLTQ